MTSVYALDRGTRWQHWLPLVVWAAASLCPFHVNLQHNTKWLYIFFRLYPSHPAAAPAPPPPCCCICVCSNFSSLIMALAVANITHIAQQRQQRPLRPCSSPSLPPLVHPAPPPPTAAAVVEMSLAHTQLLSTRVSMYSSSHSPLPSLASGSL